MCCCETALFMWLQQDTTPHQLPHCQTNLTTTLNPHAGLPYIFPPWLPAAIASKNNLRAAKQAW